MGQYALDYQLLNYQITRLPNLGSLVEERPFMAAKGTIPWTGFSAGGSHHARSALPSAFKPRSGL
jgi:hypothetical protein